MSMSKKYFSDNPSTSTAPDLSDEQFIDIFRKTVYDSSQYLKGEILTIIDASISNPTQLKAVKDMIHDKFQNYGAETNTHWGEWIQTQFKVVTAHTDSK